MDASSIRTFLAANTPNGFKSVFEPFLEGKTTYIIKGGPGTGKSGLMKKIAAEAVRRGEFAELIHCSSDPESLDGVYIPSRNVAICDGTAPHTLDPKYPGAAGGIIDLGRFWDLRALTANRSGIVSLSEQISARYAEAYRYLGAAGFAAMAVRGYTKPYVNTEKLGAFIRRFTKKRIPPKAAEPGRTYKRFLSAFSPSGYITFTDTIDALAEHVTVVRDRYHISDLLIRPLYKAAVRGGYDVYEFLDPLMPDRTVHIAIPELSMAVCTVESGAQAPKPSSCVNMSRFIDKEIFLDTEKIKFSRRIALMGRRGALRAVAEAKALHDELEKIYTAAMDFGRVSNEIKKTIGIIFD